VNLLQLTESFDAASPDAAGMVVKAKK